MDAHVLLNTALTKNSDDWVLVLKQTLNHPREDVWSALTRADQISSWGPFSTAKDLTTLGKVRLKLINMPEADEMQGEVLEVDAPQLLVFQWGSDILRWELSADEGKTLLVLKHHYSDRNQAPSYAAGWHLCLDGLAKTLKGENFPSMTGHEAEKYGWRELYGLYAEQLGISLT